MEDAAEAAGKDTHVRSVRMVVNGREFPRESALCLDSSNVTWRAA